MRSMGKYLLGGGSALCLVTLLVFVTTGASSAEFEVIDTTPYFAWGALGALLLILGAVFFAAGEVVRVVSPPAAPGVDAGSSRGHFE